MKLPIRDTLVKKLQISLPKVANNLVNISILVIKYRVTHNHFTFPQEKHRTGMIITANVKVIQQSIFYRPFSSNSQMIKEKENLLRCSPGVGSLAG
jgi:hypothetical protein